MPKITNLAKDISRSDSWSRIAEMPAFDRQIAACVYGHSATGKTRFWATFPRPLLAIVCSGPFNKLDELRSIDTPQHRKGLSCVTLRHSTEIGELAVKQKETGRFATVVLDYLGGLQGLIVKEVLKLPEIPQKNTFAMADQSTWGVIAGNLIAQLRLLLDLKCNVVLTAQEREFNKPEEIDGWSSILRPWVGPDVLPSVAGWLRPSCNYGFQTFIRRVGKKVEYCLRTGPDSTYWVKVRSNQDVQQEHIVNPTYRKLLELLYRD